METIRRQTEGLFCVFFSPALHQGAGATVNIQKQMAGGSEMRVVVEMQRQPQENLTSQSARELHLAASDSD